MKNLPNRITISRVVLIFIFLALANIDVKEINFIPVSEGMANSCHIVAYLIAILAGLTDLLDGYLARRYGWESDFGRLMDPLADKIFVTATFIMMSEYKLVPGWMSVVIISREFMVTGLRLLAASKGVVIAADRWGKLKTFLQMMVLLIGGAGWIGIFNISSKPLWPYWYALILLTTVITLVSGVQYFIRHSNIYSEST